MGSSLVKEVITVREDQVSSTDQNVAHVSSTEQNVAQESSTEQNKVQDSSIVQESSIVQNVVQDSSIDQGLFVDQNVDQEPYKWQEISSVEQIAAFSEIKFDKAKQEKVIISLLRHIYLLGKTPQEYNQILQIQTVKDILHYNSRSAIKFVLIKNINKKITADLTISCMDDIPINSYISFCARQLIEYGGDFDSLIKNIISSFKEFQKVLIQKD